MRLLLKGKGGLWGSFLPGFFFNKSFHYPNSLWGKMLSLKVCFICRMAVGGKGRKIKQNKKSLVEFQVQKTILLNTLAIQVQFKDPMAIFKRNKD